MTFLASLALSSLVSSFYPRARTWIANQGEQRLCRAAAQGDAKRVNWLISAGSDPRDSTCQPLHLAARYGHTDIVEMLLNEGADVNAIDTWNQTPLMESVWGGHEETARLLLSRHADLYRKDSHSGTVLWHSYLNNNLGLTRLLMRYGARRCLDAESVLSAAVEDNNTELVRALLQGGVDPRGVTATYMVLPLVEVAEGNSNLEMAKLLRKAGAKRR
jgi:ankyrin repeat protein